MIRAASIVALMAAPALAQDAVLPLSCEGSAPDWQLQLDADRGSFTFGGATMVLPIPQRSHAEGRDFPRALTLAGGRDTAIVILNARRCDTNEVTGWPFEANILTQRGAEPVILFGCCTPTESGSKS